MRHFGPRILCGAAKGGRDGTFIHADSGCYLLNGLGSLMAIETGQRSLHQRMRGFPLENFIQQGRRLPLWGIREDQMNPSIVGCRLRALRDIPQGTSRKIAVAFVNAAGSQGGILIVMSRAKCEPRPLLSDAPPLPHELVSLLSQVNVRHVWSRHVQVMLTRRRHSRRSGVAWFDATLPQRNN
ncbi:hypothetical protein BD309DRAFT_199506 [Dichomitus squalens]|nr:hypothetical protein BD309DRAFT_199506 [Dichomitus squalens]